MDLARKYNLKIIEDAACGFDGWIENQHGGTFGDVGCFSFHPRKSICTGEGGMLITNDDDIAAKVSQLKDHGASKSDLQRHNEKGGSLLPDFTMRVYNYLMTDMQGALGVCQMNKKEYIMNGRRDCASKYDVALKDIIQLQTPYIPNGYKHGFQSYVCIFTDGEDISNLTKEQIDRINIKRNIFMEKLESKTIATRQGTHAVHTLGYYKYKRSIGIVVMTKNIILQVLTQHKDDIKKRFNINKIGLFGSYAKECANDESDIDIVITSNKKDFFLRDDLRVYLEKLLNKQVDIGYLDSFRSFYRAKIENEIIYV
jgi:dTDP-4-amino-4,6-dideoxygalactose transaminase